MSKPTLVRYIAVHLGDAGFSTPEDVCEWIAGQYKPEEWSVAEMRPLDDPEQAERFMHPVLTEAVRRARDEAYREGFGEGRKSVQEDIREALGLKASS